MMKMILAHTLDKATEKLLLENKSPSMKSRRYR